MSKTAAGRKKLRAEGKKPMPENVADDYLKADAGKKVGKLARHVKKTSAY